MLPYGLVRFIPSDLSFIIFYPLVPITGAPCYWLKQVKMYFISKNLNAVASTSKGDAMSSSIKFMLYLCCTTCITEKWQKINQCKKNLAVKGRS